MLQLRVVVAGLAVLAAAAQVALSLGGCGLSELESSRLTRGEVVGREFDDEDVWTALECVMYDEDYECDVYVPELQYDPPHYFLEIRGYGEDGQRRTELHEVPGHLYALAEDGQWVDVVEARVVPR